MLVNLIEKIKIENNIILLDNLIFIQNNMSEVKYIYEYFHKYVLYYDSNFICHLHDNGNIYLQRQWHGTTKLLKLNLEQLLVKWRYYPWENDNYYDKDFKNIPTVNNIFNLY